MKSSILFKISAVAVLVLSVAVTAHNVTYGYRGPYDLLLATDYVYKAGSWWSTHTEVITYPPKNHVTYKILTAIVTTDRGGPKSFGYSEILKGGPGHRNVTLRFKSQRGKALNFIVQYFGR